jgi:heptosyltransferase-2
LKRNILLIPKGFFGDILLLTPVVAALSRCHSDATITVLCTPATAEFVRRDPLVSDVLVYDRRGAHKGFAGLRAFATTLREHNFDVAYSFHGSPRTALLLKLAGIPERVAFSDASLGFLYTRRIEKNAALHDVLRSTDLIKDELDDVTRHQFQRLCLSADEHAVWADLRVPDADGARLSERVSAIIHREGPYIVLSPGSAWPTKQWDAQGFRAIAKRYLERGIKVVVLGAKGDVATCHLVSEGLAIDNLCGETSLEELIEIIRGAACVVCNDSLALHICSATKTPVVVVFCATSPRFGFGPWRNQAVVLEKSDLFCKPCHRHGARSCPTGTRLCMTGVSPLEVVCAVDGFLGKQRGRSQAPYLPVVES